MAFAMTGNRVEKTLRKAGLRKFIGDQWFFPTVEETALGPCRGAELQWERLGEAIGVGY